MLIHPALNNVKITIYVVTITINVKASINQKSLGLKEAEKSINRKRPMSLMLIDFNVLQVDRL